MKGQLTMKNIAFGFTIGFVFAAGCHQTNEVVEIQRPRVSVTVSNLPHLGDGEGHYQLWARFVIFDKPGHGDSPQHDSSEVGLGEFNVGPDGRSLVALDGGPIRFAVPVGQNPQLIDDIIMTIQSDTGGQHDDPGSAFLGGKVVGDATVGVADLSSAYPLALGSAFSNATGRFVIIAPTSPTDSVSGVWFVQKQDTTITSGLRGLPALPNGWVYEGWAGSVVVETGRAAGTTRFHYFSTGRFHRADSADFDGAGPGKGPGIGFNFPGQDFINGYPGSPAGRPDLRFFVFLVTIEPESDNSPGPFPLNLFSTPLPAAPLPAGQTLLMNNVSSTSFPRARVTIVRSGY